MLPGVATFSFYVQTWLPAGSRLPLCVSIYGFEMGVLVFITLDSFQKLNFIQLFKQSLSRTANPVNGSYDYCCCVCF